MARKRSIAGKAIAAAVRGDCTRAKKLINKALFQPKSVSISALATAARAVRARCGVSLAGTKRRRRRRRR